MALDSSMNEPRSRLNQATIAWRSSHDCIEILRTSSAVLFLPLVEMNPCRLRWSRPMMISSSRCTPRSHDATILPTRLMKIRLSGLIRSQCLPMKILIAIHDDQSATKIKRSRRLHVSPGKPSIASLKAPINAHVGYLDPVYPRPRDGRIVISSDSRRDATLPA